MPLRDPDPELAHPEAAGWVLGVLDPGDADRFAEHLPSCPDCRAAIAEFGPVARLLETAAPAAAPPPDLQARALAGVAQAAAAARRAERHSRWRSRNVRMLALAAAVAVIAAISIGLILSRSTPGDVYTIALRSQPGSAASGQMVARPTGSGTSIQLTVAHLADLGPGRFYECWWVSPESRPGHRVMIAAGTFTVGPSGTATVQMSSAADPNNYSTVQITAEAPADPGQPGTVILTGTATDSD